MEKIDFAVPLTMSHPRHMTPGTSANPSLSYHAVPTSDGTQERFKDRVTFRPGIDLKKYRRQAVVDWIRLECRTKERTQSYHVSRWFKTATGVQPKVNLPSQSHNTKSRSNQNGTDFAVKVQNPNLQTLIKGFDEIRGRVGLEGDPRIIGIEISIDWYPKDDLDDRRLQMTAALMRHHLPGEAANEMLRGHLDDLRFVHENPVNPKKKPDTHYVLPRRNGHRCKFSDLDVKERCVRDRILRDRREQEVPLDSTVYRGGKGAPIMFSYQNKVSDNRNPQSGQSDKLRPEDCRSRIEVTLLGDQIGAFGFTTLSALRGFRFQDLKCPLFAMYLPTFGGTLIDPDGLPVWQATSIREAVKAGRRKLHINAFIEGGIYGLDRYIEASRLDRETMMRRVKDDDPKFKREIRPRDRTGSGTTGTKPAWSAINKQHGYALEKLSKEWS